MKSLAVAVGIAFGVAGGVLATWQPSAPDVRAVVDPSVSPQVLIDPVKPNINGNPGDLYDKGNGNFLFNVGFNTVVECEGPWKRVLVEDANWDYTPAGGWVKIPILTPGAQQPDYSGPLKVVQK